MYTCHGHTHIHLPHRHNHHVNVQTHITLLPESNGASASSWPRVERWLREGGRCFSSASFISLLCGCACWCCWYGGSGLGMRLTDPHVQHTYLYTYPPKQSRQHQPHDPTNTTKARTYKHICIRVYIIKTHPSAASLCLEVSAASTARSNTSGTCVRGLLVGYLLN